ncbi:hypothetical protein LOK49_LG02G01196 [Camellia lanceoleosa]|uniref:Uncharacterized protein n=1 Tax=Camellia lanceoleosa TaxID=1840588 RepID=A0ACC0IQ16_9ERIC|nr:hypothetical protein LOK49_LG02G01196 [Camellia lanceoleosa]
MITHGVVVVVRWWLLVLILLCYGGMVGISGNKLDDVYKQLKHLNKPALKSIKSPDGDIIDCVHISHQPAFDHPLLKNHTIQMRPSYHPESNEGISKSITQLWHLNGRCPEGTIPIRRTKKKEILRASSIKSFGRKQHGTIPEPTMPTKPEPIGLSDHEHANVVVQGDKYYGTKATMNVWKPIVQQSNEFSLSQLWIMAGSYPSDLNTVEAGWQVFPHLYGDNNPRLFIYWTRDAYQTTGCYNLLCAGFIQTSNTVTLGGSIFPISAYNASQYEYDFFVWKDPRGKWWLQFRNEVVGYWPTSLFSYLAGSASQIQWGGEVLNSASGGQHTTTQMGSGHFPEEGFGKASYIKNIQIVDGSNNLRAPIGVSTIAEQSNCYNVQMGRNSDWGNYIYYGGPGRNPNCGTLKFDFYILQCIL